MKKHPISRLQVYLYIYISSIWQYAFVRIIHCSIIVTVMTTCAIGVFSMVWNIKTYILANSQNVMLWTKKSMNRLHSLSPEIMCHEPETPENGQRDGADTSFDAIVQYSCNPGYTLTGTNTIICQENGQWSASIPRCAGTVQLWYIECWKCLNNKVCDMVITNNNDWYVIWFMIPYVGQEVPTSLQAIFLKVCSRTRIFKLYFLYRMWIPADKYQNRFKIL